MTMTMTDRSYHSRPRSQMISPRALRHRIRPPHWNPCVRTDGDNIDTVYCVFIRSDPKAAKKAVEMQLFLPREEWAADEINSIDHLFLDRDTFTSENKSVTTRNNVCDHQVTDVE
jgi:hypothetical protein